MGRCCDCQNAEEYKNGLYCNHYHRVYDKYDGCVPHFVSKSGSSQGGCFISTACVKAKNLSDDCYELTTFRHFRDAYLFMTPEGVHDVKMYYKIAPRIVEAINHEPDALVWYNGIYCDLITPVLFLLETEKYQEAWNTYRRYVQKLSEHFNINDKE